MCIHIHMLYIYIYRNTHIHTCQMPAHSYGSSSCVLLGADSDLVLGFVSRLQKLQDLTLVQQWNRRSNSIATSPFLWRHHQSLTWNTAGSCGEVLLWRKPCCSLFGLRKNLMSSACRVVAGYSQLQMFPGRFSFHLPKQTCGEGLWLQLCGWLQCAGRLRLNHQNISKHS